MTHCKTPLVLSLIAAPAPLVCTMPHHPAHTRMMVWGSMGKIVSGSMNSMRRSWLKRYSRVLHPSSFETSLCGNAFRLLAGVYYLPGVYAQTTLPRRRSYVEKQEQFPQKHVHEINKCRARICPQCCIDPVSKSA